MAVPTDKIIMSSAFVTVGSTLAASAAPKSWGGKGELPHPRLLIGSGLTFMGLSILGDIAPGIAGPISVAIAVTALTYYGMPVLSSAFGDSKKPFPNPPEGAVD